MNDLPRKILHDIIRQNGNTFFENEKQFRALINDYCHGDFKKERRCITDSIAEGIPATLLKNDGELPYELLSTQLTDRLVNFGFDRQLALWTVESWALALGCIEEKSISPKTCSLSLASNPAGAEIYVNDKLVGIAPVQLSDIPSAHYTVRVKLVGYMPWHDVVDLSEGQKKTIHANLITEISLGEVLIDSHPQGAAIYLDSHSHGATPKRLTGLKLGEHELTLTLPGYENGHKFLAINSGRNRDIIQKLIPNKITHKQPDTSTVAIDSYPSNADIYLDGKYYGQTPAVLKGITPGTYNLAVRLSGYSNFSMSTPIKSGKNPDIFWRFESVSPPQKIQWKTYSVIAICAAAVLFGFLGYIPIPAISSHEAQPAPSPTATLDPRSNSIFLTEDSRIEGNLPRGDSTHYYFDVGNPDIIRLIRIRVEGQSDMDFIVGKDYTPTFIPKRYDRIADIGLQTEDMDINNPEQGTYFITVKNKGYYPAGFTIIKTTFYK